jgi:mannosyl-oligosaccharide alpha-1,2-mannosidase
VDLVKKKRVKEAMEHTFRGYRNRAWGSDDVKPDSGGPRNSRNKWGAFIVDSSTTLALMGMWEELAEELDFIVTKIEFRSPVGLVDPFETTIRYLGGLVSLVELGDSGVIPAKVFTSTRRKGVLQKATILADHLLLAFDPRSGLPWPRVDFSTGEVSADEATIGPARAGSNFLENCVLSKLTGNSEYCARATRSWAPLVRSKYVEEIPGLVDGRIDVATGDPLGTERHWDSGHDSYYEYLLKAHLLLPDSPNAAIYKHSWIRAADAVRNNLTTRSAPSAKSVMSHLYMGKWNGPWYLNEMSHLAHFASGNLILGGKYLQRKDLIVMGQALLEGSRHTYAASPLGLAPGVFSWTPSHGSKSGTYEPKTKRQRAEFDQYGFWVADARYRLRPEYVESLFYAFRITGEQRYRDWAWDAFEAMERHCKTRFGYAGIQDVMVGKDDVEWIDEEESFWAAETLKYLYLIFEDVSVASLDDWIFSTEGHLVKKGR